MSAPATTRFGTILAVADVERSREFYERLGFATEATYDDPPYATLTLAGARLSLAEQGHDAEDRPGVALEAPADRSRHERRARARGRGLHVGLPRPARPGRGVPRRARTRRPGAATAASRSIPDGFLVELEQPA